MRATKKRCPCGAATEVTAATALAAAYDYINGIFLANLQHTLLLLSLCSQAGDCLPIFMSIAKKLMMMTTLLAVAYSQVQVELTTAATT